MVISGAQADQTKIYSYRILSTNTSTMFLHYSRTLLLVLVYVRRIYFILRQIYGCSRIIETYVVFRDKLGIRCRTASEKGRRRAGIDAVLYITSLNRFPCSKECSTKPEDIRLLSESIERYERDDFKVVLSQ